MVLNQPKPSIERICSKTTTGLAWIEPNGTVHWLNPRNTHGQWAYFYNRPHRDDGTWAPVEDMTTSNRLLEEGWIRASNVLHIQVSSLEAVNPSAWDAWANLVTECKNSSNFSVEGSIVGIASGRSGSMFDEMSVADAVDRLCSRRGKDAFWSSMMGESLVRRLVRSMLLEDLTGFKERTKGIDYMSNFDDPTFDEPYQKELPYKGMAKEVKRAWAAEADHKFMETLIKIHWVGGLDWEKKLDKFLSLGGNNEISTMGYLPNSLDVRSSWGTIGVIVQGRTTLATNDMNTVTSGYIGQLSPEIHKKYASSGTPKRPTSFRGPDSFSGGSSKYILDKDSFDQNEIRRNELIVDNWKPVGLVMGAIDAALFLDSVRAPWRHRHQVNYLDYAKGMLKHDLPMYDRQMNPIDRKALEEAVRGEGK